MSPIVAWLGVVVLWAGGLWWVFRQWQRGLRSDLPPLTSLEFPSELNGPRSGGSEQLPVAFGVLAVGMLGLVFLDQALGDQIDHFGFAMGALVFVLLLIPITNLSKQAQSRTLAPEHPWYQEIESLAQKLGTQAHTVRVSAGAGFAGSAGRGVATINVPWVRRLSPEGQRAVFAVLAHDLREADRQRRRVVVTFIVWFVIVGLYLKFLYPVLRKQNVVLHFASYMAVCMAPGFISQALQMHYVRKALRTIAPLLGNTEGIEEWLHSFPGSIYAKRHEKLIRELRVWFEENAQAQPQR